jgi:hypothetical protein
VIYRILKQTVSLDAAVGRYDPKLTVHGRTQVDDDVRTV